MADEIDRLNESAGKTAETTRRLGDALEDFLLRNQSAIKQFERLNKEIDTGRKKFGQLSQDLGRLADAIEDMEEGTQKQFLTQQLIIKSQTEFNTLLRDGGRRAIADFAASLVKGSIGVTKSLVSSYQSGAGTFDTMGDAAQVALDSQFEFAKNLAKTAQAVGAAGSMLLALPKVAVFSAALGAAGALLEKFLSEVSDVTKSALQIGVKELEATNKLYNQVGMAGATFTNGMTEFRDTAGKAFLTLPQFADVVKNNAEVLTLFGGTVTAGAKRFAENSEALKTFRRGLLNMGFTFEDQAEAMARVMEMDALSSTRGLSTTDQIAKATDSYLTNLRAITAITGEDAKKAQARAREAAMQAAVQSKLRGMDTKAQERFNAATMLLPEELKKGLQQYFVTGTISDPAIAAALANNSAAMELFNRAVSMAGDTTLDGKQVTERFQTDLARLGPEIVKQADASGQVIGTATLMSGAFAELTKVIEALQRVGQKGSVTNENAVESAEKQKATMDKLTNSASAATEVVQGLKIKIQDALTPAITGLATTLTGATTEIIEAVGKMIKYAENLGGGGGGKAPPVATTGGGAAMVGPRGTQRRGAEPGTPGPATAPGVPGSPVSLKPGVSGENLDKSLVGILANSVFNGKMMTSGHRPGDEGSKHAIGKAADFSLQNMSPAQIAEFVSQVKGIPGVSKAFAEDASMTPTLAEVKRIGADTLVNTRASGLHLHLEAAAKGTPKTTGPTLAGEAGPEAVIPLPDGRTVPVKMDMTDLVDKLEELISVAKTHASTSERILYAQS